MNIKVKICGIKNEDEIKIINKFPVNYLGFIFAESKRKVFPIEVKKLRDLIRSDIEVVGVFLNQKIDFINETIKESNLQYVQLHGDETVDCCRKVKAKVWKTISVDEKGFVHNYKNYLSIVDGILLDTVVKGQKGGTGQVFNWEMAKNLSKEFKLILAGGLNPDNILEAINAVKPDIIDLNSGLETKLIKNEEKIATLFDRLKEIK